MRAVSCHVRTALFFIAIGFVGACAGSDEPTTGSLSLNLVGQATSGNIYRLRNAIITVTGPGSNKVFNTEDDPNRTSLSANVAVGDYSALVQDGWRLERVEGASATTVEAELISPNPSSFTVFSEQRTTVPLRFRVNTDEVDLAQGYDIVLDVDEESQRSLVITNFFAGAAPAGVEVFSASANGDAAPLRSINGFNTTFVNPRGVAVVGDQLIVCDQSANAIDFFPTSASGDVAPTRQIAGPSTGLSTPTGVLVFNGEIYVSQQTGTIVVFPLAASGDVLPTRTLSGIGQGQYTAIDNGEIYATDFSTGRIQVFAASADGSVMPTRIIGGSASGLSGPTGILIHNHEIFVADGNTGEIRVFPELANGDVPPLRVITPNLFLGFIDQMAIFNNEVYVTSFSTNSVQIFPVDANGSVPPTRSISGFDTLLSGPVGAFVF